MPELVTSPQNHRKRYDNWNYLMENMDDSSVFFYEFMLPTKEVENGKYSRFIAYTKAWLLDKIDVRESMRIETGEEEHKDIAIENPGLANDWFKLAMKASSGKKIEQGLPTLENPEDKRFIYDAFLPAYRALEESFNKRSIWQWFTNHAQYTAERDALKAIKGTLLTLTGDSKAEFDAAYRQYHSDIPSFEEVEIAAPETVETKEQINPDLEAEQEKEKAPSALEEFEKLSKNDELTQNMTAKIKEMLKDTQSDYWRNHYGDECYRKTLRFTNSMCRYLDAKDASEQSTNWSVEYNTNFIFRETFLELRFCNLSMVELTMTAQKITDMMLKTYAPSGFENGKYSHYANNYILSDETRLRKNLELMDMKVAFDDERFNSYMQNLKDALNKEKETEKESIDFQTDLDEPKDVDKSLPVKEEKTLVLESTKQ